MFVFRKIWLALFSFNTRFEIRPFALLPTSWLHKKRPCSIPTKILKIDREIVSLSLSQLINNSISKGIFPDVCKLAQVIPIFKNDTRLLCHIYRHISKIFEKCLIVDWIFLEQNNCLYPFQFGFQLNYSTNNALTAIAESIQKQLDAGNTPLEYLLTWKRLFTQWITAFYLRNLITMV